MTGILSATGATVTAILTGVSTGADMATHAITTASRGLDMLDRYVVDAKEKQLTASKLEMANYRKRAILEAGKERVRHEEALMSEMHATPARKAHFDEVYAELSALFD